MKKLFLLLVVAGFLIAPIVGVTALTDPSSDLEKYICNKKGPFDPGCVQISDESSFVGLILKFLWLMRIIFWILTVFLLLSAAYQYLFGGFTGKVDKAKDMLKYAVIAMIIALVATSIPYLIASIIR